jgi:molybdopterin biosynthesis enzyme
MLGSMATSQFLVYIMAKRDTITGNPVSALVNGYLLVVPVLERLLDAFLKQRPQCGQN